MSLSDSQSQVLTFIADFIGEHEYPPTIREIQRGIGYASTSTVHTHLYNLRQEGYIEGTGRSLRLGWRSKGSGRVGSP